jgi:hypothetical protein
MMRCMSTQHDLLRTAEQELSDIVAQIAVLTKRRQELLEFIALGRKLFGTDAAAPAAPDLFAPQEQVRATTPRENSLKARVLKSARERISLFGPTHTADIVQMLEAQGIEISGKDKSVTVSVILSRSNEFVSDRKNGWSLAEEKTQQDAATSAGSSTD